MEQREIGHNEDSKNFVEHPNVVAFAENKRTQWFGKQKETKTKEILSKKLHRNYTGVN